jgi:hypothetical protein
MECPACKLVNPESASRCDCGYLFSAGSPQSAAHASAEPGAIPSATRVWCFSTLAMMDRLGGLLRFCHREAA